VVALGRIVDHDRWDAVEREQAGAERLLAVAGLVGLVCALSGAAA